jgi:hypothetical protein
VLVTLVLTGIVATALLVDEDAVVALLEPTGFIVGKYIDGGGGGGSPAEITLLCMLAAAGFFWIIGGNFAVGGTEEPNVIAGAEPGAPPLEADSGCPN